MDFLDQDLAYSKIYKNWSIKGIENFLINLIYPNESHPIKNLVKKMGQFSKTRLFLMILQ